MSMASTKRIAFEAPLVSANLPLNASTPKVNASVYLNPTKAPKKPNLKTRAATNAPAMQTRHVLLRR